jgi:anti-sigma factor RsiW
MQHGITERMWLEYVDGTSSPDETQRVSSHIAGCGECTRTFSELSAWHAMMTSEASRLHAALDLPERDMERLLARTVDKIRAAEPACLHSDLGWTIGEAMILLRSLLEPICGLGTARAAMELAVQRATANQPGSLSERNWRLFVSNLSDAVASICGSAAGRLVGQAGTCLAIEEL